MRPLKSPYRATGKTPSLVSKGSHNKSPEERRRQFEMRKQLIDAQEMAEQYEDERTIIVKLDKINTFIQKQKWKKREASLVS